MNEKEIMSSFIEMAVEMLKDYIVNKDGKSTQNNENGIIISARVDETTRKLLTYNSQLESAPYVIEIINCTEHPIENIDIYFMDGEKTFATIPALKASETGLKSRQDG